MKLPTLLKALYAEELKEFEKFLQSPFFKVSDQYLKFFKHLCKHHPGFELEKADMEAAYRRCFGRQTLTESKLYNLVSGLGRQVEQFMAVKIVLDADGPDQGHLQRALLVTSLGMRNTGAHFRAEAQRLVDDLKALPSKEVEHYHSLGQLYHQVYFNPDTPKYGALSPNLTSALEHLDLYYCIAKLRYAAEMKSRERLFKVKYELPLLDEVLQMTSAPELEEAHPLATIYNKLVTLYVTGVGEQDFRSLKQLFIEKSSLLPKGDQQLLLQHLINIGIMLTTQDCEVHDDMLALYQLAIEADMLLDDGRMSSTAFVNIATLAALCEEFDWAMAFIERFSPYLERSKQPTTVNLAKANVYYAQGKLDEAQSCLTPDTFVLPAFDIMSRRLLLKIVFDRYVQEGNDYDFLMSHLTAFERFMNTKQLAEEKKQAQLNYIKFVRKMASARFEWLDLSADKQAALHEKLEALKPIVMKKWLKERIAALGKKTRKVPAKR